MSIVTPLQQELLTEADKYVAAGTVSPLPLTGYQDYLDQGQRLPFEVAYFARRRQMVTLALAYQVSHDQKLLPLLEQVLWEVCNEYTWALPAHLPQALGTYTPSSRFWIDLFAAETAESVAEIMTDLGDDLSPFLRQRIRSEVETRIFQPFENRPWHWEQLDNNWSAVIAGSIGMAALSLLADGPRLRSLVDRLDIAMTSYLSGFGEDGACVEGVGYWAYGFGYFIYYAEKLAQVLGEDRYLRLPKTTAIAAFPYYVEVSPQAYLPFSDYGNASLPSGLLSYCHDELGVEIPVLTGVSNLDFDHCYRYAHLSRNLRWTTAGILSENHQEVSHYFADSQWLVIRDPKKQLVFGAKGGSNEESHNHLDIGHFIIGDGQQLFLDDLGAGEYTREYFQESTRYDFFVNNADSHSLPQINGEVQQPGNVAAQNVTFTEGLISRFTLDLTAIYPQAAGLEEFVRELAVDRENQQVILTDTFQFQGQDNRIVENFLTKIQPTVFPDKVILTGEAHQLTITGQDADTQVTSWEYRDHEGDLQSAYTIQQTYLVAGSAQIVTTFNLS